MRHVVLVWTAFFLVLAQAAPAWAWGRHGHRVVAKFAQTRLKPAALAKIQELLEPNEDIADASNWPDEHSTPQDAPWHYVNVPLESTRYDAMFCDPAKGCIVEKIKEFVNVLKDPRAKNPDKRRALRFVIHFVGDIHQPLHVAGNNDRGGTQLQVRYSGHGTNLHAMWDYEILQSGKDGNEFDERACVTRLSKFTAPAELDKWAERRNVEDWATESLELAKQAYKEPSTGKMIKNGQLLGDDYQKWAIEKVEERLAQSGVRLADVLNDALIDH
jgi:hypothetical protein